MMYGKDGWWSTQRSTSDIMDVFDSTNNDFDNAVLENAKHIFSHDSISESSSSKSSPYEAYIIYFRSY